LLYREDIREIAKILEKHPNVHILSDDIYEHVTYEGFKFFTIAQIDSLKDRCAYHEWCK
jgi:aspartate aminotransferase